MRGWTYGAGFGFDARNGEDTFLLLDLIAVLAIDVLWVDWLESRERHLSGTGRTAASTWACRARLVSLSIVVAISPVMRCCQEHVIAQNEA